MPDRIRLGANIALILALLAPLATAQNNNGGGPGGGRNGGGPGGGGWGGPGGGGWGGPGGGGWGGPGGGGPGGGTSPTVLIQNALVQDDLKMTDKQKDTIKQINADAEKKRVTVMEKAQKQATAVRLQAAEEARIAAEANGGTPFNNGDNGNGNNGNGNGNGNNGNGNNGNNGGGRGGRGGRNDPGNQVMRQADEEFRAQVEAALLKVLEPKQKTRIKQIALQAEGAGAFNNPEVIEKLGLTEEQVGAIEAIRNDSRQAGRQLMGQLFNNGNNGGPGGGGPGGRGGFPDAETTQTPEFQAKLKTVTDSQQKLDQQTMVNVGKALTKAQQATFNKMVGEKFDVAALRQGFLARFRPPGAPAPAPTQTASAATPPAATATTAATPAKEAAKPAARKSLRDARGGSSSQP